MLKKRLIPASILIVLIAGLFYLDHYFKTTLGFTALLCLVAIGGLYEFYKMYENIGIKVPKIFPIALAVIWIILCSDIVIMMLIPRFYPTAIISLGINMFFLISIIYYAFHPDNFSHIFVLLIGFVYVCIPLIYCEFIYASYGPKDIIYLIAIVKISDSLAYFGGKLFGRHKLAPSISPNKTAEGFVIAIFGGTIIGCVYLFILGDTWEEIFVKTFIVIFFGQMGDLLESMFKRHCQVKDSGKLLGGLGGVLDLVDSLLLAIPAILMLTSIYETARHYFL